MIVNLNHSWRIKSDELQWTLEYRPERQKAISDKTKIWRSIGFFNTLAGALREAAQRQVRELPGEYDAHALLPLCEALAQICDDVARVRTAAADD